MKLSELRKRPHWSYSSLNQLINICSLAWKFQKVDKLKPSHTSVNLVAGSVYHRTLEQVYLARKNGLPLTIDEVLELYTEDWRRSSKEELIKYKKLDAAGVEEQGRGLVKVAWDNIDNSERIVAVESPFIVPIEHEGKFMSKPFIGAWDLVVEKDGDITVVDQKTSATRWNPAKAHASMQGIAYSMSYNLTHGINPGLRFDIAVKNKTPVFESHETARTPDDWRRLCKLVAVAEDIVKNEIFYPNHDSFACADCGFKTACREWSCERPLSDDLAA
ncbi:hypothetical protein PDESU_06276 [Pontiella desulfatans]|uniref:PD-(D/E)XK endonuclease-like domain-containing protein n=1 Tax=Pontiella desulfatans TaxID=2750659 RepID=A0A6C2UE77_PONDE|nr:PD-(D/E)XK nuclease family protein [Pontiella desulfatans]VGO17674.1 hypothetical protein PDESU_06276 [Pontiella desulfatans]